VNLFYRPGIQRLTDAQSSNGFFAATLQQGDRFPLRDNYPSQSILILIIPRAGGGADTRLTLRAVDIRWSPSLDEQRTANRLGECFNGRE
jgi:hypothetical protein